MGVTATRGKDRQCNRQRTYPVGTCSPRCLPPFRVKPVSGENQRARVSAHIPKRPRARPRYAVLLYVGETWLANV